MSALVSVYPVAPIPSPLRLVILDGMTYKMGAKGQVVVPKELRERHGLQPGDEIVFDDADGDIRIRRARTKLEIVESLRGSLAGSSILEDFMAEKRREREREERKYGRY